MNGEDIVKALKDAEIIQFSQDAKYLIALSVNRVSRSVADRLAGVIKTALGVDTIIVFVHGNPAEAITAVKIGDQK